MRNKKTLCATLLDESMSRIEELIKVLPERIIDNKPQKVTKSSVIELYSSIIHNYFTLEQISIEYELLDIFDGRRKKLA